MGDDQEAQGDVLTLDAEGGQTPQKPETFTQTQVDAAIAKARNNTTTDVGRLQKALDESNRIAQSALRRLKEVEDEDYRRQEEASKDDPDELSRIRQRRRDAERQANLEEREAKVKTQLQHLTQTNAKTLASEYNVSADMLLKYAGDDVNKMEELAKSYGERQGKSEKPAKRMTEAPDSGKTIGASKGLRKEDVAKMSPEEQNRRRAEIAKISF